MKADKNTIPIYISVALSLLTFSTIWAFGAIVLLAIQKLLPIVLGLFVFTFLLLLSVPALKEKISLSAVTSAFIIYLGTLFISMSRFKSEIAEGSIDINMVGVGLALIAISLALASQRREKVVDESTTKQDPTSSPTAEDEPLKKDQKLLSLNIVFEEARRKIDSQLGQIDGLDNKAGTVLAVAGVVLTLLITSLVANPDGMLNEPLFKIIIPLILLSLIVSFISIVIRHYHTPPKLERLWSYYIYEDTEKTQKNIVRILVKAVRQNEAIIKKRIFLWKFSYYLLGVGLAILAIWIVMLIWGL